MRSSYQIAIALLYVLVAGSSVLAAPPIGSAVQTSTMVSANGRTLQKSSPLFFNDVVKTNATGVGQFVFDDGSKLAMGPSASVLIDKTIYKGKSAGRTGIQATKGAFRYISGAFSGHSLATPYGTIGIRGTAFDFTIRNGRVYLLLYRGSVNFCGQGGCKTITRSCDYLVGGGGKVSSPQALSSGLDSGLNIREAFPLLANQGQLTSQFRQAAKNCLSRVAIKDNRVREALTTGSISEAPGPSPGPTSGGNKGFGNGNEGDGSRSDPDNPGKGCGGPHSC